MILGIYVRPTESRPTYFLQGELKSCLRSINYIVGSLKWHKATVFGQLNVF